ncbi:MAG: hypothetical protein IKZ39_05800 [Lachnospiraceae bacterium]|nr:hypothetical protein [Lachnospiraceae bacterium]
MRLSFFVTGLLSNLYIFAGSIAGSVVDIEDSEVPETAAAHCNIHWSIMCIIAIYGIYAVLRAAHLKKALWSVEITSDSPLVAVGKSHRYLHFDTVIGIIALAVICLSKYYWTCSVDYKAAFAGALIVIACTVMLEIQNYKLAHREKC